MNKAVITMKKRHVRLCSRFTRNDETVTAAPALAASKRRCEIDPDLVIFLVMLSSLDFILLNSL
jgi:hypothetical protein